LGNVNKGDGSICLNRRISYGRRRIFSYDERQYTINEQEKKELPAVKKITIEAEEG